MNKFVVTLVIKTPNEVIMENLKEEIAEAIYPIDSINEYSIYIAS